MILTCKRCGNANPLEASFCFFDGQLLQNTNNPSLSKKPELSIPFVFPDGRKCISFDELVLTILDEWDESKKLLKDGTFAKFFQKIGRPDLSVRSEKCRVFPDADLGVDELINCLPVSINLKPELQTEIERINLGILKPGDDRDLYIQLKNTGLGMIKGSAVLECPDFWITLGDGSGTNQKSLHFVNEFKLHIRIQGKRLRASDKPLNAKITIETNGGSREVLITAEIPVIPFSKGCLAGAISPRKLASLAKVNPKDAGKLFEDNSVQDWYKSNGWTYPVPGPAASGVAAVQQFFEALGLVEAPQVFLEPRSHECSGYPGEKISLSFTVMSSEKRHVYAHATNTPTAPWIICKPTGSEKNRAIIAVEVLIPDYPPGQIEGRINIFSNGGKIFRPRIYLSILGNAKLLPPPLPDHNNSASQSTPTIPLIPTNTPDFNEIEPYKFQGMPAIFLGFLLMLGIFAAVVRDVLSFSNPMDKNNDISKVVKVEKPDMKPLVFLTFNETDTQVSFGAGLTAKPTGGKVKATNVGTQEPHMSFCIHTSPTDRNSKAKRLMRDSDGFTNNAVTRINGNDWFFGQGPLKFREKASTEFIEKANKNYNGHWLKMKQIIPESETPFLGKGYTSVWAMTNPSVEITQSLRIIPGAQTNKLDTVLVRYRIENRGNKNLNIGFRTLLDTFIGSNDGVPFLIPGDSELCSSSKIINGAGVPDFLQALENNDLNNPGTVANLSLLNPGLEKPSKLTLGCWPDYRLQKILKDGDNCKEAFTLWDVPVGKINTLNPADSAVTMYWDPALILPFKTREVGYSYGLGTFAGSQGQGQLALTAGGSFQPNGEFTLTAYVSGHTSKDTLDLIIPEGFKLLDGSLKTSLRDSQSKYAISWKLKAPSSEGDFSFKIQSSKNFKEELEIRIRKAILGGVFG